MEDIWLENVHLHTTLMADFNFFGVYPRGRHRSRLLHQSEAFVRSSNIFLCSQQGTKNGHFSDVLQKY